MLCAILGLYLLTRLPALKSLPVFCDEAIYIRWSQRAFLEGKTLISLLDGKPPLHPWAMMPFVAFIKDPLIAGRLLSVISGGFSTWGIYLLGRELKSERVGLVAALLYVICPFALWYDRLALAEGMLLTFCIFAVYFAAMAALRVNALYLIGTCACTTLALYTKETALLLFPVVPFAYLLRDPRQKGLEKSQPVLRWCVAAAACLLVSYGLYSLLRLSPDYHFVKELSHLRTFPISLLWKSPFAVFPRNSRALFRILFVYMTPMFFLTCFAGMAYGLARHWRASWFLLIWFAVFGVVECFIAVFHFTRFFLVLLPPLLLSGAYGIADAVAFSASAERHREEPTFMAVTTAVILLLVTIAIPVGVQMTRIVADPSGASLPYEDRDQFVRGWPAGWGIDRTVSFLKEAAVDRQIVVGAVGAHRTASASMPADALLIYLYDNNNIDIVPLPDSNPRFPVEIAYVDRGVDIYMVVNGVRDIPQGWPLTVIEKYPKDGNLDLYMYLTQFFPEGRRMPGRVQIPP